jgi:hypothetical protein
MAISYQDFFPMVLKPGKIFTPDVLETLSETVVRTNCWIVQSGVKVMNVETVLLPNVNHRDPLQSSFYSGGDGRTNWYQIVRVWYELETPSSDSGDSQRDPEIRQL